MATTIGGVACEDPEALYTECRSEDPPLPVAPWWGRANGFDLAPVGRDWGRGLILLKKSALSQLGSTADFDLTFSGTDAAHTFALKKITVLSARCASPGYDGDPNATYYCEVADRRYHLARVPIDRAYNVRAAGGTDYLTATKNSGTPWTWAQVVSDLAAELSITPGSLPFTPDGTPENLAYWGGSAWDALNDVLDRVACGLRYDPEEDTFSIVRLGASDPAATSAQAAALAERTWDAYPVDPERAWRPEKVRVRFVRYPRPTDGSSPYYTVDETLAAAPGVVSGTFVQLDDDASALGATGTPTNSAALATRAAERAADWLRKRSGYERPVLKVYRDFLPDVVRRVPGAAVGSVALDDRGGIMRTEVAARPDRRLERWRPLDVLPPWFAGDFGSGAAVPFLAQLTELHSQNRWNFRPAQRITSPAEGGHDPFGDEVTGGLAYGVAFPPLSPYARYTAVNNVEAGQVVLMWESAAGDGTYEFLPQQFASVYSDGLVSVGSQRVPGKKSFDNLWVSASTSNGPEVYFTSRDIHSSDADYNDIGYSGETLYSRIRMSSSNEIFGYLTGVEFGVDNTNWGDGTKAFAIGVDAELGPYVGVKSAIFPFGMERVYMWYDGFHNHGIVRAVSPYGVILPQLADADAENGAIYISSDISSLAYKGGTTVYDLLAPPDEIDGGSP
ncbi:unnamed protein product [Gemmataceae bacterium]|nr:unnamed protein product [Gemmataceae bacterium]VTT96578.1 unnamed protein product [Gemmataceae bacterium]